MKRTLPCLLLALATLTPGLYAAESKKPANVPQVASEPALNGYLVVAYRNRTSLEQIKAIEAKYNLTPVVTANPNPWLAYYKVSSTRAKVAILSLQLASHNLLIRGVTYAQNIAL